VANEEPKHPVLNERGEGAGGVGVEPPAAVEGEGALLRWARTHEASDLTAGERVQWASLIRVINKAVK
jgi:hypothetical protein